MAGGTKKMCHEAFVGLARVVRVRLLTDMETQDLKHLSRKILPPAMINQLITGDASGLLDHDGQFLISKQAVQKLFEWSSGTDGLGGKDAALLPGSGRQVVETGGGGASFTPATSVGSITAVDVPSQPVVRVKMQDMIAAHDETMCFAVPAADGLLSGLVRQPRTLTESERRLLEAVRDGNPDEVEELLAAAPEAVNARHPDHGATALHYAAVGGVGTRLHGGEGKEEGTSSQGCTGRMLDILLTHGADVNARADNGTTPLHWAAGIGNAACVKALLERGASPMLTTCTWARQVYGRGSGQSAAHHAAEGGHVQCLRIISAHDPLACHTKDERGSRPKELGMQELQVQTVDYLSELESEELVAVEVQTEQQATRPLSWQA